MKIINRATVALLGLLVLDPQKVRELVLTQGLAVQMARLELEAGKAGLPQVRSRYDTQLGMTATHVIDKSARTSTFFGNRTDTTDWNLSLNQLAPTGTTLGLQFLNQRTKVFGANPVIGIPADPTYTPALELGLQQSVGKNIFGAIDRNTVKAAEAQVASLDYQTQHQVSRILADAETLYWNWRLALELQQVAQNSLKESGDFLKATRRKADLGAVEKTALLGAEAQTARRQAQLQESKILVDFWEGRLKQTLQIPEDSFLQGAPLVSEPIPVGTVEATLRHALQNRADFLAQKKSAEQKELELKIAKQSLWPTIDLAGSLRLNEVSVGDYGAGVAGMDSPRWTAGLSFQMPLGNRMARGAKQQADYEKARALVALKNLETTVVREVRHGSQAVSLRQAGLTSAERARDLQREKLREAMKSYEQGRLSAELILKFEDDALEAERNWLQALLDYRQAVMDWELAKHSVQP